MRNINGTWLKSEKIKYEIEELKKIKNEIIKCSNAYKDVFNGPPFYESWDLNSAKEEIDAYIKDNALILTSKLKEQIIGFLVVIDGVPENQREFVEFLEDIKFIEEIGVLNKFRKQGIASEMVRIMLLKYLNDTDKYLGYRTNAMRYFDYNGESFESAAMRIQKEDKIKRINNEKIIIPEFSLSEKQKFINKYIELIQNRPDLDVSNSNQLFRSIFDIIDFGKIKDNYSFQKDPTGEVNDRIFPIIDLSKTLRRR